MEWRGSLLTQSATLGLQTYQRQLLISFHVLICFKGKKVGAILTSSGRGFHRDGATAEKVPFLEPTCWNSLVDTIHSGSIPLVYVGWASLSLGREGSSDTKTLKIINYSQLRYASKAYSERYRSQIIVNINVSFVFSDSLDSLLF